MCQKEVKSSGNTTNLQVHLQRSHQIILTKSEPGMNAGTKRKATIPLEEVDQNDSSQKATKRKETIPLEELDQNESSQKESVTQTSTSSSSDTDFTCGSSKIEVKKSAASECHVMIKTKQTRVDQSFSKQKSFQSGSKAAEVNSKLIFMLAKYNMPFRTVNKEGFQEFVKALNPFYKIPNKNTVTKLIEEKYEVLSEIIKDELSKVDALSLTTDIWTDTLNSKSYLGLTVHYILKDDFKTVTIGVIGLDDKHTAENIKNWLLDTISNWRIKHESIVAVVSDNAANMKKALIDAFGSEKFMPCFAHTLNLVPARIIESDNIVNPLIKKVKTIVTFFKHNVFASDQLRSHNVLKLIQSVETRWNSTYDMLNRFIQNSDAVSLILLKCPTGPTMLDATELQIIKEFIDLLKPFEEATKIICGEAYITSSKIIPVISILRQNLENCKVETQNANHLKKALMEQFNKRFENIERMTPVAIACLLDPRFKKIHFMDRLACSKAIEKISNSLREMASKGNDNEIVLKKNETNASEENNFWHLHHRLVEKQNIVRDSRNEEELYDELKYYLNQPTISMTEDPIKFWNRNPTSALSKLAKRYLAIVATSVPSERLFSKAGRILTEDRNRLSGKHLDQLLFLSSLQINDWHFNTQCT